MSSRDQALTRAASRLAGRGADRGGERRGEGYRYKLGEERFIEGDVVRGDDGMPRRRG